MKCFFSNPDFDYQLVRLLDSAKNQGADISECLATSIQIEEGDTDSWYYKWKDLADLVRDDAEKKLSQSHSKSAQSSFLRASNYYRYAYSFLYYENVDQRILNAYDLQKECFKKALIPSIPLKIPFGESSFNAHFYPSTGEGPAPTLIINQGYDGSQQDSFFQFHQCCRAHHYNLLTFDGPGQGEQLIYKQIKMTTEWDQVVTPLLNELLKLNKVDPKKIYLFAEGWGSLFAAKAASCEPRISALILTAGAVDPLIGIERFFPEIRTKIEEGDASAVNTVFAQAMSNRLLASKLKLRMLAHGVDSSFELMKVYAGLNLAKHAQNIRCPTFIFECPDDPLLKDQANLLYDLIPSSKKSIHNYEDFGVVHSWSSIMTSSNQSIIFDWLDEQS